MIQTTTNLKCLQRLQNFKEMIGTLNSFIASSNLLLNVPKRLLVVAFYYGQGNAAINLPSHQQPQDDSLQGFVPSIIAVSI